MTEPVMIMVDGRPLPAHAGQTVAAALVAAGIRSFGANAKTGAPLAPFCLMGVCFGCLCEIDGRGGEQACLHPVREGLSVHLGQTHGQ